MFLPESSIDVRPPTWCCPNGDETCLSILVEVQYLQAYMSFYSMRWLTGILSCHENLFLTSRTQVKKRNNIMHEDRDIRDIRAGLILREGLVKDAETKTRGQHDYRFVLQYFSASRDLHRTLVANVNYLANEVEQLRANMDHNSESISIMEQQFVELEVRRSMVYI